MSKKKLILEIVGIAFFAGLIGLAYNYFNPKGIPYIYEKPKEVVAEFGEKAETEATEESDGVTKIVTYAQVKDALSNPDFFFIDARSPETFEEAKIGDAINIFPYQDDESVYISQLTECPMDKTIIIYCDGGNCDLSHEVAEGLRDFGYTDIYIYSGGWEEWEAKLSEQ